MHEAVLRDRPAVSELLVRDQAPQRAGDRPAGRDRRGADVDGAVRPVQGPRDGLHCGVCTGGVRLFTGIRYGRPIIDWKHTDVPPGTQPHRPILGTPVDAATLDRVHRTKDEGETKAPKDQPRLVHLGPATADMLASSQSITAVLKLLDSEGWTLIAKQYGERNDGVEYLILKMRRRDLKAVAIWKTGKNDSWVFDDGWALDRRGVRQVTSTSLKEWLRTRDEECPDCSLSSVVHDQGECP